MGECRWSRRCCLQPRQLWDGMRHYGFLRTECASDHAFGRGEWSEAVAGKHLGPSDNAVARVWHERNWMVDMHEAPGAGMTSIHTGQMCFDPQAILRG